MSPTLTYPRPRLWRGGLTRPRRDKLTLEGDWLWDLLYRYHGGRERAIGGLEIGKLKGLKLREVTELVHEVRQAGFLLASCTEGYFYPRTREEKDDYLQRERRRVMDQLRTHRQQRQAPCEEEQEELEAQEEGRMF